MLAALVLQLLVLLVLLGPRLSGARAASQVSWTLTSVRLATGKTDIAWQRAVRELAKSKINIADRTAGHAG